MDHGLRCEVTKNPCGTDTWRRGYECPCAPCQRYIPATARAAGVKAVYVEPMLYEIRDNERKPCEGGRHEWVCVGSHTVYAGPYIGTDRTIVCSRCGTAQK